MRPGLGGLGRALSSALSAGLLDKISLQVAVAE
jgi:hypothetical protein